MSVNGISSMLNTRLRMSGMASGLDTETIIEQMMSIEKAKVDKAEQERQRLEWKRDDYREITNLLRSFKDDYFDVLKPASNMRSESMYQSYSVEYGTTGVVTAVGSSETSILSHNISVINLAKAASSGSTEEVGLSGTAQTMSVFTGTAGGALTVNGVKIDYTGSDTVEQFMKKVNSSEAGVTLTYSSYLKKFTITQNSTGASGNSAMTDTGGFLDAAKMQSDLTGGLDARFILDGKDSALSGETFSNNTFNIDGINYTLLKEGESTSINLKQDTDAVYNNIKSFIDSYNSLIEKINNELSEKYYRDYAPLTESQREAMSEDEIKKWEEKAKSGSLKNDSLLSTIVNNMRKAMSDVVEGISGTLASIGISTGAYTDKGKLIIDETKLKTAIKNTPDKVKDLFSRASDIDYSPDMTPEQRAKRDKENGIVNRLYDILQDNIRTTRNNDGKKGLLLEKAGIIGDLTEFNNFMNDRIEEKKDRIDILLEKMYDKEDYYYKKFTAMETALNQMNSQSSWLSQQFGS